MYYAILNLGSSEMGPVNKVEYAFCTLSMILSSVVYNNLFGQIVNIYSAITMESTRKQLYMDEMFSVMSAFNILFSTKSEVN